jgi:hypothetical protein
MDRQSEGLNGGSPSRTKSTFMGMLGMERFSVAPRESQTVLPKISKEERVLTRICLFLPVIGPLCLCEAPSFDDAERTLQLFGLITTLFVGIASGSIDESGFLFNEPGSTGLPKNEEEQYLK